MGEIFEELSEAPKKRGFGRGAWDIVSMKKEIEKLVNKAKRGGKKVFGVDVEKAWEAWHGGEPGKYAGYYLGRKIKDVLDDMGIEGYDVYSVTVDGRKRVIINLASAKL